MLFTAQNPIPLSRLAHSSPQPQVHDEVMFEGPSELADEALKEVVACMRRPFDEALPSLLVDLAVDAKVARTWYDAK